MQMSLFFNKEEFVLMCESQELQVRFKFALCWMKEFMILSARATSLTQQSELVHNEASEMVGPLNEWVLNGEGWNEVVCIMKSLVF